MNWLAHLFLSEPDAAFRIGNLLPDLARMRDLAGLPADFQRGMRRHVIIDVFTDSHPIVRQSKNRFAPPFRRYAGILVDIFYDHFLACDWHLHSSTPLAAFAAEVYASFDDCRAQLPGEVYMRLSQMKTDDWLCSYADIGGIEHALRRLSTRLRRPIDLAASLPSFEASYDAFRDDFHLFFPQLVSRVHDERAS